MLTSPISIAGLNQTLFQNYRRSREGKREKREKEEQIILAVVSYRCRSYFMYTSMPLNVLYICIYTFMHVWFRPPELCLCASVSYSRKYMYI